MKCEFNYILGTNEIVFKDVTVLMANFYVDSGIKQGKKKKYKIQFLIPKDSDRTKSFITELCDICKISHNNFTKMLSHQLSSIKDGALLHSDDQKLNQILKDNYVVVVSSSECFPRSIRIHQVLIPVIGARDIISLGCTIQVYKSRDSYAKKNFRFSIVKQGQLSISMRTALFLK